MGNTCGPIFGDDDDDQDIQDGDSEDQGGWEYTVQIEKQKGDPLGLQLSTKTRVEAIVIDIAREGAIAAYNKAGSGTEVKFCDKLVAVNSTQGALSKLVPLLRSPDKLELTFRRPKEFSVHITKGEFLGIGTDRKHSTPFLPIDRISAGSLQDLNRQYSDRGVMEGDCIVEVNGIRGVPQRLAMELKEAGADDILHLRFMRWVC